MENARSRSTVEKSLSLADQRLRELSTRLDSFFQNPDQSSGYLIALFEQYNPSSSSIYESIIDLYSNSLNKPTLNKLLDKSIEYLRLNNEENLRQNPYYLQEIKFDGEIENRPLLHNAIQKNYENIFRLLLKSGFNPNSVLSDHKTPLSIAVVANHINPMKRLEYIQLLLVHGANPTIRDVNDVSPFKRLCGMESNYSIVYSYFRDYLISFHPDQVQTELNSGLENALFNWSVPIVSDLLEHGATLDVFEKTDSLVHFFSQIASTFFKERRSISYIDPFIRCLIQILSHHIPCQSYSTCLETFLELIYIPGVCFETNNDPFNHPSMTTLKQLLSLSFYYGYLTKESAGELRTKQFPKILTTPIQNPAVSHATRQQLVDTLNQYMDELVIRYHQSPVPLTLLSARHIRQALVKVNQKNIEQLNISRHLNNMILLPQ